MWNVESPLLGYHRQIKNRGVYFWYGIQAQDFKDQSLNIGCFFILSVVLIGRKSIYDPTFIQFLIHLVWWCNYYVVFRDASENTVLTLFNKNDVHINLKEPELSLWIRLKIRLFLAVRSISFRAKREYEIFRKNHIWQWFFHLISANYLMIFVNSSGKLGIFPIWF